MTRRWQVVLGICCLLAVDSVAEAQITSIPPIMRIPTYGTPPAGRPAPWRRANGRLFGRRWPPGATVPQLVPGTPVPAASYGCNSGTALPSAPVITPGTVVAPPAAGQWHPVPSTTTPSTTTPSTSVPAPIAPSTTIPSTTIPAPTVPAPAAGVPSGTPRFAPPGTSYAPPAGRVQRQHVIVYYAR